MPTEMVSKISFVSNQTWPLSQTGSDEYPHPEGLTTVAATVCIIVAIIGSVGNLMTLLAIPWAIHRKKLGFHKTPWKFTHIFIVNLALADFLYCTTSLPLYSLTYISRGWPGPDWTCYGHAVFKYINSYAAFMALGFVALSRCLGFCFPKWNDVLLRRWCYHFVICIWIYATLLIVPTICEWYGKFGYDKELGKCDYIITNEKSKLPHPRTFFLGISFLLPLLIITGSYTIIWKKAKSRCFLRQGSATEEDRKHLEHRDWKVSWTLFAISFCYIAFVLPIFSCSFWHVTNEGADSQIHLICFMVYWFEYIINFVIYAAGWKHYREAYILFLKTFVPCCFRNKQRRKSEPVKRGNSMPPLHIKVDNDGIQINTNFRARVQTAPSVFVIPPHRYKLNLTLEATVHCEEG